MYIWILNATDLILEPIYLCLQVYSFTFALQVKMSIFTEVSGMTSDTFLLHQMQKELKYQANVSPTQRNEKHLKTSSKYSCIQKGQLPT